MQFTEYEHCLRLDVSIALVTVFSVDENIRLEYLHPADILAYKVGKCTLVTFQLTEIDLYGKQAKAVFFIKSVLTGYINCELGSLKKKLEIR